MPKCKGCQAEIIWITTIKGKQMPCDAEKTTVITDDGKTITGHIPHWATCPVYKTFKKSEETK